MPEHTEVELKFLVPAAARTALVAELTGRGTPRRVSLTDSYFDTPDWRLGRAGLAWRMRREGRRWVQGLKAAGAGALERFEHEVERPDASLDPQAHAQTSPGQLLLELHSEAVGPRFQIQQRRLLRRVRTRGAVVDIALDEGRLTAGAAVQKLCEIEFELVSGSPVAMLALVERWRRRFGLVYDPRNKAERGHALATGSSPLRKARTPRYGKGASALEAFGAVFDECLAHVSRNAIGLIEGDPELRAEHVHQMRVGIRRLRSALRAFRGWVAEPPAELMDGLRALFAELGKARDSDVLGSGVAAELQRAGAPPLTLPADNGSIDLTALIRNDDTQQLLLAWITWRTGLQPLEEPQGSLKRLARQRLRRWHKGLVDGCHRFDELEPAELHALRKHAKRQRYALEFFTPLLPRKRAARHLQALAAAQQALGKINDLVVAHDRYRALVASDPAAWFAVGWLTARLAEVREQARDELSHLAAIENLAR
ncbi:inorganic triphosphatase YgiF [Pelomonas saccharophila]|uniref:Inorganic triphosphatase YgiF n=1 Tax=Roseateles saccharophilus TaxID=304 RepID=A0ABU1YNB0_ROSSA|nr:CHAD domain-containing protein [Roseateles saccharophilus]MDR7269720.1 inorganic triphosphatase YgiF [Roseateles saccharophilus]